MKGQRFTTLIRRRKSNVLPFAAYLTDHLTNRKLSNTWETKKQCEAWLEDAKRILTEARPN